MMKVLILSKEEIETLALVMDAAINLFSKESINKNRMGYEYFLIIRNKLLLEIEHERNTTN